MLQPPMRWFAAATLPRREMLAAENLEAQGFGFFLPRMRVTKRHARRLIEAVDPIFPGYIFIHMDPERAAWRSINGTRGIRHLVMGAARPLPVRAGVVETLIASLGADGLVRFVDPLRPGDTVRLLAGPFAEALGQVVSLDARGRVTLLLALFGTQIRAEAARESLVAA